MTLLLHVPYVAYYCMISNTNVGCRDVATEYCFNVECSQHLSDSDVAKLHWLFSETYEPTQTTQSSHLTCSTNEIIVEVGPRLTFSTAWSSNCVSMCTACGITAVTRIERSRRYKLTCSQPLTSSQLHEFALMVHDRMTECVYSSTLTTFQTTYLPEPVKTIPLLSQGRS
jgi:phosphoribosylformylglycinamidine synthase